MPVAVAPIHILSYTRFALCAMNAIRSSGGDPCSRLVTTQNHTAGGTTNTPLLGDTKLHCTVSHDIGWCSIFVVLRENTNRNKIAQQDSKCFGAGRGQDPHTLFHCTAWLRQQCFFRNHQGHFWMATTQASHVAPCPSASAGMSSTTMARNASSVRSIWFSPVLLTPRSLRLFLSLLIVVSKRCSTVGRFHTTLYREKSNIG